MEKDRICIKKRLYGVGTVVADVTTPGAEDWSVVSSDESPSGATTPARGGIPPGSNIYSPEMADDPESYPPFYCTDPQVNDGRPMPYSPNSDDEQTDRARSGHQPYSVGMWRTASDSSPGVVRGPLAGHQRKKTWSEMVQSQSNPVSPARKLRRVDQSCFSPNKKPVPQTRRGASCESSPCHSRNEELSRDIAGQGEPMSLAAELELAEQSLKRASRENLTIPLKSFSADGRKPSSVQDPALTAKFIDDSATFHVQNRGTTSQRQRRQPAELGDDSDDDMILVYDRRKSENTTSPTTPRGGKDLMASAHEAYYETMSSISSAAALIKNKFRLSRDCSDLSLADTASASSRGNLSGSVYDTVTSGSSSAPLLRRAAARYDEGNTSGAATAGSTPTAKGNVGKALLLRSLEQVKRSLVSLTPTDDPDFLRTDVLGNQNLMIDRLPSIYVKNLCVLSASFMFLYTAFFALRNLQSSINPEAGLGLAGLACVSASFILFCFLAPAVIHCIRPKFALVFSMCAFFVYQGANMYPRFTTLIPASVVLGGAMACLWVSQGTYLTSIAFTYAAVTGKKADGVLALFNGFFLFCLQSAQILGNLIASALLTFSYVNPWEGNDVNVTHTTETSAVGGVRHADTFDTRICGANYCHSYVIDHINLHLGSHLLITLLSVFIGLTLCAVLLCAVFLDKLDVIFHRNRLTIKRNLLSIGTLHADRRLLLLITMVLFLGLQGSFLFGEVTKV